jgi:hypothetical protein
MKKWDRKWLFKKLFPDYYTQLESKTNTVKILNEENDRKKIELKEATKRINRLIEENTLVRRQNGELRNEVKKVKDNIIKSKEYETLLSKYNELLSENNDLKTKIN